MKKFFPFMLLSIGVVFLLAGCNGLNKMKKNASTIKFEVNPEVLEMHGGNVAVSMDARFPEKYFSKKAVVVATPVLKSNSGEVEYKPVTLQGEKVTSNNKVINFKSGGRANFDGTVPYADNLKVSELYVKMQATQGKKSVVFDPIKVADGVIATPLLLSAKGAEIIIAPDKFQRIIPEAYEADIHYKINSAKVEKKETTTDDINKLKEEVKTAQAKDNVKFRDIQVSAFASPDGKFDFNDKLAGNRSQTASKFFKKELDNMEISKASQDEVFKLLSTAEDWEGFKELVGKSNIQDKDLILRVLSMYNDPDVREKEIRNISSAFTELADQILPQLRRSKLTVNVDVIGKSDAELKNLALTKPADLNVEEILYAATLVDDVAKQNAIYKSATNSYPRCYRAWNDLGLTYVQMGDFGQGKAAIEKASGLNANNAIILNNMGVMALVDGNYDKAEGLFRSAAGAGNEVDHNLGIVNVKKGNYSQAVSNFGSACLFNAALAQTLSKDYAKAMKTMDCIENPSPMVNYLKAIVYARQGQGDQMLKALGTAVAAKPALKDYAKTDMEFGKYFADPKFQSVVK